MCIRDSRTAVLGGITEIQEGALIGNSLEQVSLPNAVTVGDSAFYGFPWLEKLDLSGAKTIGKNAFQRCTRLTSLTLNAVEKLGEGSFKYTDSLKKLTLPETIKNIEDIRFGLTLSGNKSGTVTVSYTHLARMALGKKITATDEKYLHMAEESLYAELSLALGIPENEMGAYITKQVESSPLHSCK